MEIEGVSITRGFDATNVRVIEMIGRNDKGLGEFGEAVLRAERGKVQEGKPS